MVIGKLFGEKRFRQLAQMHIPATFERLLVNAGGQAQQPDRSVGADRRSEKGFVRRYGGSGMMWQVRFVSNRPRRLRSTMCVATDILDFDAIAIRPRN
jgi:hypothetical protein